MAGKASSIFAAPHKGTLMLRHFVLLLFTLSMMRPSVSFADDLLTTAPATQPRVPIIRLTPAAAKEILAIIQSQNLKNPYLRVGVKQEGTKFSYILDITEDKPAPEDTQIPDQGITILINPKAIIYLAGTTIDFKATPTARSLLFQTPNALPR